MTFNLTFKNIVEILKFSLDQGLDKGIVDFVWMWQDEDVDVDVVGRDPKLQFDEELTKLKMVNQESPQRI